MDDELDAMLGDDEGGGMFPFLAILNCTIAVMILILMGGAMAMVIKDPKFETNKAEAKEENELLLAKYAEAESELSLAKKRVADKRKENGEQASLARQARQELNAQTARLDRVEEEIADRNSAVLAKEKAMANLEKAMADQQSEIDSLTKLGLKLDLLLQNEQRRKELQDAQAAEVAATTTRDGLAKEIERLKQQQADAERERRELIERAKSPEVRLVIDNGETDRTPIYIEVRVDGILLHEDLAEFKAGASLTRPAAGAQDTEYHRLARMVALGTATRYAVLLVRPGGWETLRTITSAMGNARAPYTVEPVDAPWTLNLKAK